MNLIDKYVTEIRGGIPYVIDAGRKADGYAARVCAILDAIYSALVTRDDHYAGFTVAPPATNAPVDIARVPAGEVWVLEAFCGPVILGSLLADGNPRYSTANAAQGTIPPPIRFVGPCSITVAQTSALADARVYVQFKVLAKRARPSHDIGAVETGLAPVAAERQHDVLHEGLGVG